MRVERLNPTTTERDYRHLKSVPSSQFQYVDVAFGEANVDVVIPHTLKPLYPEEVNWQVVRQEATVPFNGGRRVSVPFNAGNFSSVGGGTAWTVIAANQVTFDYIVKDDEVTVWFTIINTNVTGAPTALTIAIPAGLTSAHTVWSPIRTLNAGTVNTGFARVANGATVIELFPTAVAGGWTATSASNTLVQGSARFAAVQLPATSNRPPGIYRDASASRRVFGADYIVLRSDVAGARVRLLLTVDQE